MMRLGVVAITICLCFGVVSAGVEAERIIRRPTQIAPQELAHALQILAKERDVQMVYRSELVSDRQTYGASGVLSFEEALTQLLRGTGLVFRYLDDSAVTLVRDQCKSCASPIGT